MNAIITSTSPHTHFAPPFRSLSVLFFNEQIHFQFLSSARNCRGVLIRPEPEATVTNLPKARCTNNSLSSIPGFDAADYMK